MSYIKKRVDLGNSHRQAMTDAYRADETRIVKDLLHALNITPEMKQKISTTATKLVTEVREHQKID